MSSQENLLVDSDSPLANLRARLITVQDFRAGPIPNRHLLVDILAIAICAVLGGANNWLAVERFGRAKVEWLRSFLQLNNGIPSHDTFRRVFMLLDKAEFNKLFIGWVQDIHGMIQLGHIAIDGKTLRGSDCPSKGLPGLHLVHAFATDSGICLAQQATDAKSNEITAIPQLLRMLSLKGALVTIDAMGCQKDIAAQIVDAEADYLLTVKGNQPRLHDDLKATFESATDGSSPEIQVERVEILEQSHGRMEKRTCTVAQHLDLIRDLPLWKGLKTVGMINYTSERGGKTKSETRYFISSKVLGPEEMLKTVRDHWKVENQLHWVLDVVFGEDGHQLNSGNGPDNFATLLRLVQAVVKSSDPKHGIKGTREMAGWNTDNLEKLFEKIAVPLLNPDA